jgi:hypothetical protein
VGRREGGRLCGQVTVAVRPRAFWRATTGLLDWCDRELQQRAASKTVLCCGVL